MSYGNLILNRFTGQEEYSISDAEIFISKESNQYELSFGIATNPIAIRTLPDTKDLNAQPNADFTVHLKEFSLGSFVGSCYQIPYGFDKNLNDFVTRFCYVSHEETNNNVINIISKKGNRYQVTITGEYTDSIYYEGAKPNFIIDAWFILKSS